MTATRRIVFAPDGFKGSVSATEAARAIATGWADTRPDDELVLIPMADGGEGTLEAFATAVPGACRMTIRADGPDGIDRDAEWLLLPPSPDAPQGTGVVELAGTSGIELLEHGLQPWDAHTRGFGQAIAAALHAGVSRLVLGIGSSASTDGGTGLLSALGARFLDADGRDVAAGARGLADIRTLDLSGLAPLPAGGAVALSDVPNPLVGPTGAAAVFGPQKGLGPADVAHLDAALGRLAELYGLDPSTPGAGAAGGTGLALLAWGARLVPGAIAVAELMGLDRALEHADLVVTGEGAYDGQTAVGKAPAHVAERAARLGIPVAVVAGRIDPALDTSALAASLALVDLAPSTHAAMTDPALWLRRAGAELARTIASGHDAPAVGRERRPH